MVTINRISTIIVFFLFLLQGCSPPSAIVKPYVQGKQKNSFTFKGNTCYFKAHTKQLSAIYIDFWFDKNVNDSIVINPEGLNVILKSKSYDYSVSDKNGKAILKTQPVIEGDVYTINSYFDKMFFNTNDTIKVEFCGFITVDGEKPNLPPIHFLVDSISR
jgi:hypothetical protein